MSKITHKKIEKWVHSIKCEIGEPITTQKEASRLATILESEVKLNPNYFKTLEENSKKLLIIEKMTNGLYADYINKSKNKS